MTIEKCRECKESRCIMSKYYGLSLEEIIEKDQEEQYQERKRKEYNAKIKAYYEKETKYWKKFKDREASLINYDRWNETDQRHDNNWFQGILKLMDLQEQYYNSIKY